MCMYRTILLIIGSLTCQYFVFSQRYINVLDSDNKEPVSFVKIVPDVGSPFFTDIDGKATIHEAQVVSITLSFLGYYDTIIELKDEFHTVYMRSRSKNIDEIVVLPGENPAHRIIKKVTENRKLNHPIGKESFTYDSYSKFVVDIDSASLEDLLRNETDTSDIEDLYFLKQQHLFMMESASKRTYIPPSRDREDIVAYKVSGFKNPIFASFAQSMQSFHFYDNIFRLLGREYFNPVALGGMNRYFFLLEDSTFIDNDTVFLISFRPKSNVGVETMTGMLFINSNGYAIEKVIAQPSKQSEDGFFVKIIQEYQFIDNKKWFPIDLKTTFSFGNNVVINNDNEENGTESEEIRIEGQGNTYIKNVVLNPLDVKKKRFNNVALSTDPNAGTRSEEYWQEVRKDSITEREQNTYNVIDSLSDAHNLNLKVNGLLALTTGRIRLKYIALPIDRIVNFNLREGYRLGLGLESSDLAMKNIVVGSYFAYGTRDKEWKYGAYSIFHLNRRLGINIGLRFQQDLMDRGGNDFTGENNKFLLTSVYRHFYRYHFDEQRLGAINFSISPIGNLTVNIVGGYQRIGLTQQYVFKNRYDVVQNELDVAETVMEIEWNIRQKILFVGDLKIPQTTSFPRIKFRIAKGWNGIENSQLDYWRFFISMNEDLKSLRFGQISLYAQVSQTVGDVPLTFKQNAIGTRHDFGVVTKDVLETAFPSEFYHDQQITFISRYFFPSMSFFKGRFSPQVVLHHGIGYGKMSKDTQHNIPFHIMDKGLFEGGIIVKKILSLSSYSKIGIGVFYRYGDYSETDASKNFVVKVDIGF